MGGDDRQHWDVETQTCTRAGDIDPERSSLTLCDLVGARLVGGRLRQDRDVRFQSADISMVDCRSHVPARLHLLLQDRETRETPALDRAISYQLAAKKGANKAVVAVARELSGFVWGAMTGNIGT